MRLFAGLIVLIGICASQKNDYFDNGSAKDGEEDAHASKIAGTISPAFPVSNHAGRLVTPNCANESNEQHCEDIPYKGETKIRNLVLEAGGAMIIDVVDVVLPGDVVVIWFETIRSTDDNSVYYESSNDVSCRSSAAVRFRVGPLLPNIAYTVCVVSKAETTVSPLDCMPYYNQTSAPDATSDVWILEEDKAKWIGFVICGAVASLLFGLGMSFVLIRRYPACLKRRKGKGSSRRNADRRMTSGAVADDGTMAMAARHAASTRDSHSTHQAQSLMVAQKPVVPLQPAGWDGRTGSATDLFDYLPPKEPPPLPPPNTVPVLYGMARSLAESGNIIENYYSQVGVKNRE